MKKISIYALINPINDHVFYIGATMEPKARLSNHTYATDTETFKAEIIKDIISRGLKPEMLILDEVDIEQSSFFENFYIDLYRFYGFTLKQSKSSYTETFYSRFKYDKSYGIENNPYTIRLGKLKPELEKLAKEKNLKFPDLIKKILYRYIKNHNARLERID